MAYEYIKRAYRITFTPGERIAVDGRPGIVTRPQGDPQYVGVRFDGHKHSSPCHPMWKIERLSQEANP